MICGKNVIVYWVYEKYVVTEKCNSFNIAHMVVARDRRGADDSYDKD